MNSSFGFLFSFAGIAFPSFGSEFYQHMERNKEKLRSKRERWKKKLILLA